MKRNELLYALGGAVLLIAVLVFINRSGTKNSEITSAPTCEALANSVEKLLKLQDSGLVVRSWLPELPEKGTSIVSRLSNPLNPLDPFCNSVNGRTPICDTAPLVTYDPYVDRANYKIYQNLRSTAVWAQSVYNANTVAGICVGAGKNFSPPVLGNILPTQVAFPPWVTSVDLYIRDAAIPCGSLSNRASKFDVKLIYHFTDEKTRTAKSCSSQIMVEVPADETWPSLTAAVTNGLGETIGPGACSNRLTVPQILAMGNPGTAYRDIKIGLSTDEPGTVLLVNKGTWEG
ncbi:MAG: hypothetical protein ABL958_18525, partial [Bdellovibrionia bacterium]